MDSHRIGRYYAEMVSLVGVNEERKHEKTKMEEMHQQKVEQMIKSSEASAGHLHKITKPKLWRRSTDLGGRRRGCEVVGLL